MTNHKIQEIIEKLQTMSDEHYIRYLYRNGIRKSNIIGVKVPKLRLIAKKIGIDHQFASELWNTEIRELRIIASLIADPTQLTIDFMTKWASISDSWEIVDYVCANLFWKSEYLDEMIRISRNGEAEFHKRYCFVWLVFKIMKRKNISQEEIDEYKQIMHEEKSDKRNLVKKAIIWLKSILNSPKYVNLK